MRFRLHFYSIYRLQINFSMAEMIPGSFHVQLVVDSVSINSHSLDDQYIDLSSQQCDKYIK